jgi:hypothetical protein
MVYTRPPDSDYDGQSMLGSWWIDTGTGLLRMDLAGDLTTGWIHATAGGVVVLSMPRPSTLRPVVVSDPLAWGGHQVVVYGQTLDDGDYVSCDVFVDGYSLSTSEPASVISQRFGEVANARRSGANRGRRSSWRWYG